MRPPPPEGAGGFPRRAGDRAACAQGGLQGAAVLVQQERHRRLMGSTSRPRLRGLRPSVRSAAQVFRGVTGPSIEGQGQQLGEAHRPALRPPGRSMWTQMSPQNSHRICRQGPQGAASMRRVGHHRDRVEPPQALGDGLEDRHPLGAQVSP